MLGKKMIVRFSLLVLMLCCSVYIISCESKTEEKNTAESSLNGEEEVKSYTIKMAVYEGYVDHYADELRDLMLELYGIETEIIKYQYDFTNDKFTTKLLAGESDFDIYCMQDIFLNYYAKNSACYDLSSTKEIADNFNSMFDGTKELCTANGKLCGIPLTINTMQDTWGCNIELAQKLGIDIEELSTKKMTWKEFYDFSVAAKSKAESLGIDNFYVFSNLFSGIDLGIHDYMTNYFDYTDKIVKNNTDDYVEYLNIYMKMMDEKLITTDSESKNASVLFNTDGSFDYYKCDNQIFPKPLISVEDSYVIGADILAVNPNSNNIAASVKYLEYASSLPVLKRKIGAYLLKDRGLYEYYNIDGERVIYESATNGHEVKAFMIKNGRQHYFNRDIFNEMSSYNDALRNREMKPEDFAQKLYDKSKMIIEE